MIKQEFSEDGSMHRLVDETDGSFTPWAGYTQITMHKGMVGVTAYYADKEQVLTPHEFCVRTAVRA